MILFYNLGLFVFSVILKVASVFHPKARAFVTGRKNVFNELDQFSKMAQTPVVWIHCASLGEFEQGRPVIEAIKQEFPEHRIVLSFFSPSGFEVRKGYRLVDLVCYLPLDTASNAKRFITLLHPVLAIFVKYEFWYHYTHELKRKHVPLISVSSIFRSDQMFFSGLGGFSRKILTSFTRFFVQNQESVKLLQSIGIDQAVVTGDTRFDRVNQIVHQGKEVGIAKRFKDGERVMIVGSAWPEDMEVLIPFINENKLKFIIAPHEISESFMSSLEKALQVQSLRYSEAEDKNPEGFAVLIIDNIGMLSSLYRYGEFAFIGGAYGKGLHNILEAACYGVPILFGNKSYEKFQEAVDLINRGGAFEIADYPDLKAKYEMLNIPETFQLACEVTRQYVEENLGATEKIMEYCRTVLTQR